MQRLLLKLNKHGKVSIAPGNPTSIGRREPITIQMVPPTHAVLPSIMLDNYVRACPLIPSTPVSFWPKLNDSLKDRINYVQDTLSKIQADREKEELQHYAFHSGISDEEIKPYLSLGRDLCRQKDIDLGEPAIPFHLQQRDLGSLNDRSAKNKKPHEVSKNVVSEPIKPRKKSTYSKWSE